MSEQKAYPIAEHFRSLQGEGAWTGTYMQFVRLAGCSVGKGKWPYTCTRFDGKEFICDTAYQAKLMMTAEQIVELCADLPHVCLTGGEPFDHKLAPLVCMLLDRNRERMIHIETSGTKHFADVLGLNLMLDHRIWITVSPKKGVLESSLQYAKETKWLVDADFKPEQVPALLRNIFVQPINHEHGIDNENVARCLDIIKEHPGWRLSLQLHKVLGLQ